MQKIVKNVPLLLTNIVWPIPLYTFQNQDLKWEKQKYPPLKTLYSNLDTMLPLNTKMVQFTDFYRKFTLNQLTLHSASSFERPYPARSESDDFKSILNLQLPPTRVGTVCVQEFWNTWYLTPSTHIKNLRHSAIYRIKPYRGRRDLTGAVIHRSF